MRHFCSNFAYTLGAQIPTGDCQEYLHFLAATTDKNTSMTQLLTNIIAHFTKPSSRAKTNNQSTKKFVS